MWHILSRYECSFSKNSAPEKEQHKDVKMRKKLNKKWTDLVFDPAPDK